MSGAERIRQEVAAEAIEDGRRRALCGPDGGVGRMAELPARKGCSRNGQMAPEDCPQAVDRTPCSFCGVRADVGCRHQRRMM